MARARPVTSPGATRATPFRMKEAPLQSTRLIQRFQAYRLIVSRIRETQRRAAELGYHGLGPSRQRRTDDLCHHHDTGDAIRPPKALDQRPRYRAACKSIYSKSSSEWEGLRRSNNLSNNGLLVSESDAYTMVSSGASPVPGGGPLEPQRQSPQEIRADGGYTVR